MALEDIEIEAAPIEATMEDLDDICPTDREIAEVEAGSLTPVLEPKPVTWSWSGVKDALIRGTALDRWASSANL